MPQHLIQSSISKLSGKYSLGMSASFYGRVPAAGKTTGRILPRRERAPQGPSSSTRSCWFCSECLVWAVFRCSPTQPFWMTRMGLGLEVLPVLRLKLVKSVSGSSGSSAALYLGNQ